VNVKPSTWVGHSGTPVAQEVGARLGWPVYDHELLKKIAEEMGLRVNLLESVDERHQSWLLESLQSLSSSPQVTESRYVRHLVETILSLGIHGQCVIVGRGAAQLLPEPRTLRVRLVARREDRVERIARMHGLTRDQAERKTDEIDRDRFRFVKSHFHKDPTDLLQYDLILNASRWSVAECAGTIIDALRRLEARQPGDVR
jgi:cytidylate kinase